MKEETNKESRQFVQLPAFEKRGERIEEKRGRFPSPTKPFIEIIT